MNARAGSSDKPASSKSFRRPLARFAGHSAARRHCGAKGQAGLVIDVRDPAEFTPKHIPGAINIPRGQVELAIQRHLGYPAAKDMSRRITPYCGSGIRCILAISLQDRGFTNVVAAVMRLDEWDTAGNPPVAE